MYTPARSCLRTRHALLITALVAATLAALLLLGACTPNTATAPSSSSGGTPDPATAAAPDTTGTPSAEPAVADLPPIKIGTLQTEDLLPLWVAESEGLLTASGLKVEIITFQSAQEQIAAITAGEIDAIMTDMVVPVLLNAGQTPVRAVTTLLGTPAGIATSPKSGITSLKQLANVPIGVSSPTVIEYVIDRSLARAGVPATAIKTEEIKKLPVRFELLMAQKIKAAGLPWTLMALAEQQGATAVLDRQAAKDYTSTVLAFRQAFLDGQPATKQSGGSTSTPETAKQAVQALLAVWDSAAEKINANPQSYRALLVEKVKLPKPLEKSYAIQTYPKASTPDQAQFEDVVSWMQEKAYLKVAIPYEDLVLPLQQQ